MVTECASLINEYGVTKCWIDGSGQSFIASSEQLLKSKDIPFRLEEIKEFSHYLTMRVRNYSDFNINLPRLSKRK